MERYYDLLFCLSRSYRRVPFPGLAPDRVDDSNVTSKISPDDVIAALKRLKRGKAAIPNEISNTSNRDYADALGPIIATFILDGLRAACSRRRLVKRIFSV